VKPAVVFDFGGVMADEGFREGLKAIARENGLDEEVFFARARDLIYESGYVTGAGDEHAYWQAARDEFGITGSDEELRGQVLRRFVVRPEMFNYCADLRDRGHTVALLTDQTDWLYELDRANDMAILSAFDFVFNSYDLHMSKRNSELFRYVEKTLRAAPKDILFVDDNPHNVEMAGKAGWTTVLFRDHRTLQEELSPHLRNG
jgi:putative hydrolase of the HAD superfamily